MKTALSKFFHKRFVKPVAVLLVLCVAAAVVFGNKTVQNKLFGAKPGAAQRTATVAKGDLSETVSGSGAIYAKNDKILYAQVSGTLAKVNYDENDTVKAGAVIAAFDDSTYKATVQGNQISLQQAQLALQSDETSLANLTVPAPFSGQVTGFSLKKGDPVQNGEALCTIADTSLLQLQLSYNVSEVAQISVGQAATVYDSDTMQRAAGTVSAVNNVASATSAGGSAVLVTIQVKNPGALASGDTASADITTPGGTVSSTDSAKLAYVNAQKVTAQGSGTVETLNITNNQQVSAGAVLCTLKNDTLAEAISADRLKIAAAQTQYDLSLSQAGYYQIVAPFDGTLTTLKYKSGNTVAAGTAIAEVADPKLVEFDISVDELDIPKLAVGQPASVTLDALPDTSAVPLKAVVEKIAAAGTTAEGVTSYAVTIRITSGLDRIKEGMNANADVTVKDMKDVLYIPREAVVTRDSGTYVWVKGSGSSAGSSDLSGPNGSYYTGDVLKKVSVGDSNDTFVAVESGLKLGDAVVLPRLTTAEEAAAGKTGSSGTAG